MTYKDKDRALLSPENKSKLNFVYANAKLVLTDVRLSHKRPLPDPIANPGNEQVAEVEVLEAEDQAAED